MINVACLHEVSIKLFQHREKLEDICDDFSLKDGCKCRHLFFLIKIEKFIIPFLNIYKKVEKSLYSEGEAWNLNTHLAQEFYNSEKEWFKTFFREFCFIYACKEDHDKIFGDWTVRNTSEQQYRISGEIFDFILERMFGFARSRNKSDGSSPSLFDIEVYIFGLFRENIFSSYATDERTWAELKQLILELHKMLDQYIQDFDLFYRNLSPVSKGKSVAYHVLQNVDYYQIHKMFDNREQEENFVDCGIEIEFQAPSAVASFELLGGELENIGTKISYTPSEQAYKDGFCVLSVDESLPQIPGYFPAEFSSSVLNKESDIGNIADVLSSLRSTGCCVDESAGIHMHVSREQMSLTDVKAIVLSYAQIENLIRRFFFSADREKDLNLYASSIYSFMFGDEKITDRKKSFFVLAHFLHTSRSLCELKDAVACGNKYCGLFLHSKYTTLEFRGHPSSLLKERVVNYILFLQAFVSGAIYRRGYGHLKGYVRRARMCRSIDDTTVLGDQDNVIYNFNQFDFKSDVSIDVYRRVQCLDIRVSSEIIKTGKLDAPICRFFGRESSEESYRQSDIQSHG